MEVNKRVAVEDFFTKRNINIRDFLRQSGVETSCLNNIWLGQPLILKIC